MHKQKKRYNSIEEYQKGAGEILKRYLADAIAEEIVNFLGRLGTNKYANNGNPNSTSQAK